MAVEAVCLIPDCGKAVFSRGYCGVHYNRLRRNGDMDLRRAERGAPMRWIEAHVASEPVDECVKWPFGANDKGYGVVSYEGRLRGAHRLVCLLAHGEPDDPTLVAAHSCGQGALGCVNKQHLRWRTTADNCAEMGQHMRAGIRPHHRRLSDEDVAAIRSDRTRPQKALAAAYGVSESMVSRVVNNKHPYCR